MKKLDVIRHFGTPRLTADKLKITTQAVHKWGDVLPYSAQLKVERATKGKFKAVMPIYNGPRPYKRKTTKG